MGYRQLLFPMPLEVSQHATHVMGRFEGAQPKKSSTVLTSRLWKYEVLQHAWHVPLPICWRKCHRFGAFVLWGVFSTALFFGQKRPSHNWLIHNTADTCIDIHKKTGRIACPSLAAYLIICEGTEDYAITTSRLLAARRLFAANAHPRRLPRHHLQR